jgi:hypothetical protein
MRRNHDKNMERVALLRRKRDRRRRSKRKIRHRRGLSQHVREVRRLLNPKDAYIDDKGRVKKLFVQPRQRKEFSIPRVFSFLDDPKTALEVLERLENLANREEVREIHLNHENSKKLGLCASVVMDQLLIEADRKRSKSKSNKLHLSGTHSRDLDVNIMLRATGILRHMGHPDAQLPPEIEQRIRRCSLFSGKARRSERSEERDIAGTKLVDYFNECLETQGHMLSTKGRRHLSALITEAIGNAEEHGGRWFTIGYFIDRTGTNTPEVGECHIVLFNHGNTIYESLSADKSSESVKKRAGALARQHTKSGWFTKPKWSAEALWTLYALQGGVSRLRDISPTRGNGTIEMIKVFSGLAGTDQRMCLVSGSAYILFDGRYGIAPTQSAPSETQNMIAFNRENDLNLPPDEACVYNLPFRFPGTLLSIRFNLEKSHLARLAEQENGTSDV